MADRDDEKLNAVRDASLPFRDEESPQPSRSIVKNILDAVLLLLGSLGVCFLLMILGVAIYVTGLRCSYS